MYRQTYAEIDLNNIKNNVVKLKNYLKDYKYFIAVVKADSYSHGGIETVNAIIQGGANYLAVATLDEALFIRKFKKNIPILCLGVVDEEYLNLCIKNNITITIPSLEYLHNVRLTNYSKLKVHLKINTGMNRLGISTKDELNETISILEKNDIFIEGIYTHMYKSSNEQTTQKQIEIFNNIVSLDILKSIPIVHFGASEYLLNYPKVDYVNGARIGIAMYGLVNTQLDLGSTFSLHSKIIQINEVNNETVGYEGNYQVVGNEKIAVVPIGYADGVIRDYTGMYVYINNKKYYIVGNICMDMLFVKVDETVSINDKVTIIKDNKHIYDIANHLNTISYEVLCMIGKRIPRIYK